jgi:hypothetical protein
LYPGSGHKWFLVSSALTVCDSADGGDAATAAICSIVINWLSSLCKSYPF